MSGLLMVFLNSAYRKFALVICAVGAFGAAMIAAPVLTGEGLRGSATHEGRNDLYAAIRETPAPKQLPPDSPAVLKFKDRLLAEHRDLGMHGVYIESLADHQVIAAVNQNALFNPASVMKIATSLAALDKLGPQHRFVTQFASNGKINQSTKELEGDLIVISGGDPSFSIQDARSAGEKLRAAGVTRVKGDLVVVGSFTCNENSQTDVSAGVLRRNMSTSISGRTTFQPAGSVTATPIFTIQSEGLLTILQDQNAHSINAVADAVGEAIGGPLAVRRFLVEKLGLKAEEVFVTRTSGLETNRLSAVGTSKLIKSALVWLEANGYKPQDLMPVGGMGASTIAGRFVGEGFSGSVIAKTGTLHETDNGAANLAGIAYTKRGPIVFVIYDMAEGRNPAHLRRVQDEFLMGIINELGGPVQVVSN